MDTKKKVSPTSVRLNLEDRKALAFIKRLFSRSGAKMTTSVAIKAAIHDTAERLKEKKYEQA